MWEDVAKNINTEAQRVDNELVNAATHMREEKEAMRQETDTKFSSYAHKSEVKDEIQALFGKDLGRELKNVPGEAEAH